MHIVPGYSAAGSMKQALDISGRDQAVLPFRDDLSCGPIAPDEPYLRQNWWRESAGWPAGDDDDLHQFWDIVRKSDYKLIVWFSRYAAFDLAFRLSWAWHMAGRDYHIIDVTDRRKPFRQPDESTSPEMPPRSVGMISTEGLLSLMGSERPVSPALETECSERWSRLMAENAPFRVVTENALESASIDYFDRQLLEETDSNWRSINRVIGAAIGKNMDPFVQVGDWMLFNRVVALVEKGDLIADGDLNDGSKGRVRRAWADQAA